MTVSISIQYALVSIAMICSRSARWPSLRIPCCGVVVAMQFTYPRRRARNVEQRLRRVRRRRPVRRQDHVAVLARALGTAELAGLVVVEADLAADRREAQDLLGRLALAVAAGRCA